MAKFNFKVVSTGQKPGNRSEEPKLRLYPNTNGFKLNYQLASKLGVTVEDGVTIHCDPENKAFAIHKADQKVDSSGNKVTKDVKLTNEQREQYEAEGKEIPQTAVFDNGVALRSGFNFTSSYAMALAGIEGGNKVCDVSEIVSGDELGLDTSYPVALVYYESAEGTDESEEEEEEEEEN